MPEMMHRRLLPTPTSQAAKHATSDRGGATLDDYNLWTVALRPEQWGEYAPAIARHAEVVGRPAPEPTIDGKLSPAFVEWMMMLPEGWVTDPALGLSRTGQLRALGNAIVWPQAFAAWGSLLGLRFEREREREPGDASDTDGTRGGLVSTTYRMSELERALLFELRVAGVPTPEREYHFHPQRRWRFDLCWPDAMVACEVEGGSWVAGRHTRGKGFEGDCEKASESAIAGWRVLRVTTDMVADGRALALIERALAAAEVAS